MTNIDKSIFSSTLKKRILSGEVGVLPTDTLYGLSGRGDSAEVIERILSIKGRQSPCSLIFPSIERALEAIDVHSRELAAQMLPCFTGPFTTLWPAQGGSLPSPLISTGLVGVRFPHHGCSRLAQELGVPLVTTSVNRTGEPAVCDHSELPKDLEEELDFWVEDGYKSGPPSTIVFADTLPPFRAFKR